VSIAERGKRLGMFVAALIVSACARSEQPLLAQFFGASRLRDLTALQGVATVVFEPREQGIVRTFVITGVSPERIQDATTTKDVTVQAPVVLPDGQTVQKTLVVTLQRAVDGADPWRGWRVVRFRDAEGSPPSPLK
jgi:hypothetical protein